MTFGLKMPLPQVVEGLRRESKGTKMNQKGSFSMKLHCTLPFASICLLAALSFSAAIASAADAAKPLPDILLIMPDQMRGDAMSAVGNKILKTPTIDKLASEGVVFRRGYSSVPSCIPARYALLTGFSPQKSGVVGFASRKIDTPTLPEVLGKAG